MLWVFVVSCFLLGCLPVIFPLYGLFCAGFSPGDLERIAVNLITVVCPQLYPNVIEGQ